MLVIKRTQCDLNYEQTDAQMDEQCECYMRPFWGIKTLQLSIAKSKLQILRLRSQKCVVNAIGTTVLYKRYVRDRRFPM